jgi:hypothetical protein
MKKANFVLTALVYAFICLFVPASCSDNQEELYENHEPGGAPGKEYAPQQFAKRLAYALKNNALRHFIQQEAALQKDGDYDILLADAIDKETANEPLRSGACPTLRDYLKGAMLRSAGLHSEGEGAKDQVDVLLDDIEDRYPLLQMAVPNFDGAGWEGVLSGDEPFLVAFLPEDYREGDHALAYDQDGREYRLDGKEAPPFPVVVVNQNERLVCAAQAAKKDYKGLSVYLETGKRSYFLRNRIDVTATKDDRTPDLRSTAPASRGSLTDEPRYTDYIWKARFKDNKAIRDYESWLNGRPEVCCEVVFSSLSDATARTIEYSNKGWWNGAVYECNTPIVKWDYAVHGYYIAYHWYESDGGSAATTVIDLPPFLSPEGFLIPGGSVTISHCKMDDPIGTTFVDYASANEQAFDPAGTGKFTWWCAYR